MFTHHILVVGVVVRMLKQRSMMPSLMVPITMDIVGHDVDEIKMFS